MKQLQKLILFFVMTIASFSCSKKDTLNDNPNGKSGSITKFAVVGNYMYTLSGTQLVVYDIVNPADPRKVNAIGIAPVIETIFSYGQHLYVGAPDGIYIVDIIVPDKPVLRASERHFIENGCDPVVVKDNIAYSTIRSGRECGQHVSLNEMQVIDVSNPSDPYTITRIPLNYPGGLGYDGNTLFVCDGEAGIAIFDITDPRLPKQTGLVGGVNAYDLITDNGTLIVSSADAFSFYDYTDLGNIKLLYKIARS